MVRPARALASSPRCPEHCWERHRGPVPETRFHAGYLCPPTARIRLEKFLFPRLGCVKKGNESDKMKKDARDGMGASPEDLPVQARARRRPRGSEEGSAGGSGPGLIHGHG